MEGRRGGAGWGLLLVSPGGAKNARLAQLREVPSLPWGRLAALLRAACREGEDLVPRAAVHELARGEVERAHAEAEVRLRSALDQQKTILRSSTQAADRFAEVSGLHFGACRDEDARIAGAAVRGAQALQRLEQRLGDLHKPIEQLTTALAALREHVPQPEKNSVVESEGTIDRGKSAEAKQRLHAGEDKTGS